MPAKRPVKKSVGKPAKKPVKKHLIFTRELDARTMTAITEKMHKKTGLGRVRKPEKIEPKMERLRKMGEYLIKRKFRSSPEEKFFVELVYKKGIKFSEKSRILFDYFLKDTKSKKIAKKQALALADSIEKKVATLSEAYGESVNAIQPKELKAGAEHMFSTHPIHFGIVSIREHIKEMN